MEHLPKWLYRHVQKCQSAFGLGGREFRVLVQQRKCLDADPTLAGDCTSSARYLRATVRVRRDIQPDADGYERVTHEMLHAAMFRNHEAVTRIIGLLPKRQRALAWDLWYDGNEATVTRLARGLAPLLEVVTRARD